VHEDQRRPALPRLQVGREEELVVDLHAVGGLHDDDFGNHVGGGREVAA
jgi:hypothetical protein